MNKKGGESSQSTSLKRYKVNIVRSNNTNTNTANAATKQSNLGNNSISNAEKKQIAAARPSLLDVVKVAARQKENANALNSSGVTHLCTKDMLSRSKGLKGIAKKTGLSLNNT